MQNQKINSIGLLAIFLVIAIPTVYGAIEPSIIINMDSGQSEKPLQIKNSGGTIVFSVDTDGTIFPDPNTPHTPPVDTGSISIINFASLGSQSTLVGDVQNNPVILWQVDVDFNATPDDYVGFYMEVIVMAQGKRDSGSGTCRLALLSSVNSGATWVTEMVTGATSASNERLINSIQDVEIFLDTNSFAVALYNSDGATTCTFQDIQSYAQIFQVEVFTYTRVI